MADPKPVELIDARIVNNDVIIDVKGVVLADKIDETMTRTFRVLTTFEADGKGYAQVSAKEQANETMDIWLDSDSYTVVDDLIAQL